MDADLYLLTLKKAYSQSFDLASDFLAGGKRFPLYGRFNSVSEKYVLVQKARLWEYQTNEHLLVLCDNAFSPETLDSLKGLIERSLEPELVRGGEKYPPENHMMTYLTIVILSEQGFTPEAREAVKKFSFVKNYLFTFRGRMETHVFLVDLSTGAVIFSRAGKPFSHIFSDIYAAALRKKEGEKII